MNTFKILAVAVALTFGAVSVNAQKDKTFSFIDAAGNEVADGSTVIFYAEKKPILPELGIYGPLEAKFDLKIKNNTNADAYTAVRLITKNISSGDVTCCLGTLCVPLKGNKDYTSGSALVAVGKSIEFPTEWFPDEEIYGDADFTAQLMKTNESGNVIAYGLTVNVHCIYADPTGITDIESADNATEVARYDLNGRKLTAPQKGLNIIKLSNGKTVKKVIK